MRGMTKSAVRIAREALAVGRRSFPTYGSRASRHKHPAALHPDIGLIGPPRSVGQAQVGPEPPLQFRCMGLDPPKDGGVRDVDTAVLQHQLKVAVADREHQVPAHCPENHLRRELPTFKVRSARSFASCRRAILKIGRDCTSRKKMQQIQTGCKCVFFNCNQSDCKLC